MHTFATC